MNMDEINRELVKRYQKGDKEAGARLIEVNRGAVGKVVSRRYHEQGSDCPWMDLMQEGYLGLLEAAKRMDLSYPNTFLTYALFWINQYCIRANIYQGYSIRVPDNVMTDIKKLSWLDNKYGYMPDERDRKRAVAEEMGWPMYRVETFYQVASMIRVESLDQLLDEDRVRILVEDQAEPHAEYEWLKKSLENAMETLTHREQDITKRRNGYYTGGDPETLEIIGKDYGVCRDRIRQIEAKAYRKMRHPRISGGLREFLYG